MPELPEVETIRLGLQKKIVGLKIRKVKVLNPKSFQADPRLLQGKKVLRIFRKAKVLGIELESELVLLIHLKMSGQLIFESDNKLVGGHPTKDMFGEMPNRSTRVIFEFSDGSKLYFNDQRKFGWIKLIKNSELSVQSFLSRLGPEPLEKEFSWQVLKQNLLRRKTQAVKVALLDQQIVSGIGNIYASEACFLAKINPKTKVSEMTLDQFKNLHQAIIKSLQRAIKYGGSSKTHFVNEVGKKGYFLDYAFVYGREGDICKVCSHLIKKIKLNARGTYFCPHCQR